MKEVKKLSINEALRILHKYSVDINDWILKEGIKQEVLPFGLIYEKNVEIYEKQLLEWLKKNGLTVEDVGTLEIKDVERIIRNYGIGLKAQDIRQKIEEKKLSFGIAVKEGERTYFYCFKKPLFKWLKERGAVVDENEDFNHTIDAESLRQMFIK